MQSHSGTCDISAGTIGARVTDGNGNVWALSNNHVYADQNDATIGDAVIQPGDVDGGTSPDDDIGTLADFEPIVFEGACNTINVMDASLTNEMDAAIALADADSLGNSTPSAGYGTPSSTTIGAALNMKVKKAAEPRVRRRAR